MKANLSGIIWSVAPVSATRREVRTRQWSKDARMECAGGLFRSAKTFLGRQMVRTHWGPCCKVAGVDIDDWQEGGGSG